MNYREAIRRRFSIRHYETKPVPEGILDSIEKASRTCIPLDKNINVGCHLIKDGKQVADLMTLQTGRSWLFGSAPHFIIATAKEKPGFMLETGFRMEQMILLATMHGLGTCWIGGLFIEEQIAEFLQLNKKERVIAITPLGHPDNSFYGRTVHNLMHVAAPGSQRRKPFQQIVSGSKLGSALETADNELLEVLECTRLAPSWTNSQPWKFLVDDSNIIALAEIKSSRFYHGKLYYRLDVGIAMCHFYLSAKELGWKGKWQVAGFDPSQVAEKHAVPNSYEVLGVYNRQ